MKNDIKKGQRVFVHARAHVAGDVTLCDGADVWCGACIRGDIAPVVIGKDTNIQDNVTVHVGYGAPAILGEGVTVGHNAVVHGCTVGDNVLIGMQGASGYRLPSALLRLPSYWKQEKAAREKALSLLAIFGMESLADTPAGSLPYGAQRRLEIVRALATDPKVLLLDEPAAGMNPAETAELMENIRKIRDEFKIAVVLIEHDMNLVMGICEGIAVLNYGQIIAKGTPEEIRNNPLVIEAYLGRKEGAAGC